MLAFRAEKCLNIWREKYLVIWLEKKGLRLAGKLSTIFYVWNVLNWIEEMSTCDKKKKNLRSNEKLFMYYGKWFRFKKKMTMGLGKKWQNLAGKCLVEQMRKITHYFYAVFKNYK